MRALRYSHIPDLFRRPAKIIFQYVWKLRHPWDSPLLSAQLNVSNSWRAEFTSQMTSSSVLSAFSVTAIRDSSGARGASKRQFAASPLQLGQLIQPPSTVSRMRRSFAIVFPPPVIGTGDAASGTAALLTRRNPMSNFGAAGETWAPRE